MGAAIVNMESTHIGRWRLKVNKVSSLTLPVCSFDSVRYAFVPAIRQEA